MSISAGMQTLWPSFCSLTDIFLCQTLWRNHCAICHWSLVGLDPILGSAYMCIKKNLCPHDQLSFYIIGPQRVSDRYFCYHCSHSICKFEIDKHTWIQMPSKTFHFTCSVWLWHSIRRFMSCRWSCLRERFITYYKCYIILLHFYSGDTQTQWKREKNSHTPHKKSSLYEIIVMERKVFNFIL